MHVLHHTYRATCLLSRYIHNGNNNPSILSSPFFASFSAPCDTFFFFWFPFLFYLVSFLVFSLLESRLTVISKVCSVQEQATNRTVACPYSGGHTAGNALLTYVVVLVLEENKGAAALPHVLMHMSAGNAELQQAENHRTHDDDLNIDSLSRKVQDVSNVTLGPRCRALFVICLFLVSW